MEQSNKLKLENEKLIKVIKAALDCPSHFYKPTIKNPPKGSFKPHRDECFTYGKRAIVLCEECVKRMEEAIKDS